MLTPDKRRSRTCLLRSFSSSCRAATARLTGSQASPRIYSVRSLRVGTAPLPFATGCTKRSFFNYNAARPTKTAMDVFTERTGVCRDFQHLAITLSRCQNIPARYVTGYIGDIRMPYSGPGDFSAWYQVFLDGQWMDLDARHNYPRLGRILVATGRDAADVAITTSFGAAYLTHFYVESCEIDSAGNRIRAFHPHSKPLAKARDFRCNNPNSDQLRPIRSQPDPICNFVADHGPLALSNA